MGKRKLGALEKVEADLPNLQYKIRRDPQSYRENFVDQYNQYETNYAIFVAAPSTSDSSSLLSLREYVDFVAHVADCYPDITANFPKDLIVLLEKHHKDLEGELREKIVGSLVLLRNKDVVDSTVLMNTLFPLLIATTSKTLRQFLFTKIISDLRSSNSKTTNHKLNRSIQTLLHNLITSDPTSPKGLWAVKITRELWKRQIWTDAKAVEIMQQAALADSEKVIVGGVRFFLGGDKEREELEDEESDNEVVDMGQVRHQMGINKKTKKRAKDLKKAAQSVKKDARKKNAPHPLNFSALHLLHDPQGFAEDLFAKHLLPQKSRLSLDHKLTVLQLVTRLVGLHQLTLVTLYTWFLKFLTPRQQYVTTYLACSAQAAHAQVPPDLLTPCIQKIANEFVSEASASEIASAGLNAIREICARQPLAMEDTLLQDLVMYRKSKDKGVVMAAKGLMSLYRDKDPEKLKKRDRGKDAALSLRSGDRKEPRFGEQIADETVAGIELLEEWKADQRRRAREEKGLATDDEDSEKDGEMEKEEEEGWKNWDAEETDDDNDSGGWIDVESDGEEIQLSDSSSDSDSDNGRPSKKARINKTGKASGKIANGAQALEKAANDEEVASSDGARNVETATQQDVSQVAMEKRVSTFATTRILTPADLAKLRELQATASIEQKLNPHKHHKAKAPEPKRHNDDPLTAAEIEGLAKMSYKSTKEEKIALARGGKEGDRSERGHQSTTAKRKEKKVAQGKSTTNKEKAREKNFFMTLGKAKRKGKRSLGEARKVLKGHVARARKGGRRGNVGQ